MSPAYEKIQVETSFGTIWLWGRLTGRPVMLILSGAMADAGAMDRVWEHYPELDVIRGHLPGNHCPRLVATSIGIYAAAYAEALDAVASERPLGIVGLSTGALVAMAMRNRSVRGVLAIEPPLRTEELWPLAEVFARHRDPDVLDFAWNVFGMGRGDIEPRDYTLLLDSLRAPAIVMLGDDPLHPRRPINQTPTLVDEKSRAALRAHPGVRVVYARNCGHNVPVHAIELFLTELKRMAWTLTAAAAAA